MEDMSKIMSNPDNANRHSSPMIEEVANPNFTRNAADELRTMTGLPVGEVPQPIKMEDRMPITPGPAGTDTPPSEIPQGAVVEEDGTWRKTYDPATLDKEIYDAAIRRAEENVSKNSEKSDLMAAALRSVEDEEGRLADAASTLDDDNREELYHGDPRGAGMASNLDQAGNRVTMDSDGVPNVHYTPDTGVVVSQRRDDIQNMTDTVENYSTGSMDDLTPSYGYESQEEADMADDAAVKEEEASTQQFGKYISSMEEVSAAFDKSVVTVTKDRQIDVVPSGRNKNGKFLNDQAFLNSITKFKKDNFSTVSIPLVNSGFSIEIVGTGPVDLINLYYRVNENTDAADYELEKMRAVMRNVVGTRPHIDPMQLRNMIHFADYSLMSFAHICATLDKVENIYNCDECGKPFRVTADPKTMILNYDTIHTKAMEFDRATSVDEHSLLTRNYKFTTESRFEITIGHPSYADSVHIKEQIKSYSQGMNEILRTRFVGMEDTLMYIRFVKMPNGVITSNVYQAFTALNMLTPLDLFYVNEQISKLRESIVTPMFGMRDVVCPHCKKHMAELPYENNRLDDLVFYHALTTRLMMEAEKSGRGGENG